MSAPSWDDLQSVKRQMRAEARSRRRAQPDKDRLSRLIWDKVFALSEYAAARTVMVYVHLANEVRTQPFLPVIQGHGKRLVIPYCVAGELELFRLEGLAELQPGTVGILEPKPELRGRPAKRVEVGQLDLVVVPGVAFDRRGARLGHGKGYYDRLLARTRSDTALVGVAFQCQLFAEIPVLPHDVCLDKVVTEKQVYLGQRQRPSGVQP